MDNRKDGPDDQDLRETGNQAGDGDAPEVVDSEEEFERRLQSEYPGPSEYDIALSERDELRESDGFAGRWLKSAGAVLLILAALGLLLSLVGPLASSGGSDSTDDTFASARVQEVLDGNTIVINLDGNREVVRYIGVSVGAQGESYYRTSQIANQNWVDGEVVILERDGTNRDAEGRLLRYVYVQNQMVNAVLLASGLARYQPHHANDRHNSVLLSAEDAAREARRGIWAGDDAEGRPA